MNFKKAVALCLALSMAVCVAAGTIAKDVNDISTKALTPLPTPDFDENNVVVKFGVLSDTHFYNNNPVNAQRVEKSINLFKQNAGGEDKLDAVTISGDVTDWNGSANMPAFNEVLTRTLPSKNTEMVIATGNHDVYEDAGNHKEYNMYEKYIGDWTYHNPVAGNTDADVLRSNYHTIINGVHFITVYGIDGDHASGDLKWLEAQLKMATEQTPDMPVFVITHVAPANTVYGTASDGSGARWYSNTLTPVLAKYPQAVAITGHSHNTTVPETTIWQKNFTAINAGPIKTGDGSNSAQAAYAEVDKNGNVKYTRYFLNDGATAPQEIKDTWTFKTMKSPADAVYSIENQLAAKEAPYFEDNRKEFRVTGKTVFNTATFNTVFDSAKDSDMVMGYKLLVRDKATKEILQQEYISMESDFGSCYNPSVQMPIRKLQMKTVVSGLKSETEYELCAMAVDSFGGESAPLVYNFKTDKFSAVPTDDYSFRPVMDFDYLPENELLGTSSTDTNSVIKYDANFAGKAELTATTQGALSGKALNIKSIKGTGTTQVFNVNPLNTGNPYIDVNAKDPAFFTFYLDTTGYKQATGTMTVKITESDFKDGKLGADGTFKLKNGAPIMFVNESGYKNALVLNDKGEFNYTNKFKGYIMIPLSSFVRESGVDGNGQMDGQKIKNVAFDFFNIGYKGSNLVIDEIGFAVAKGSQGSKDYVSFGVMPGDVNGDGSVKTVDALLILRHIAQTNILEGKALTAADFDLDGQVRTVDSLKILRMIAGM